MIKILFGLLQWMDDTVSQAPFPIMSVGSWSRQVSTTITHDFALATRPRLGQLMSAAKIGLIWQSQSVLSNLKIWKQSWGTEQKI